MNGGGFLSSFSPEKSRRGWIRFVAALGILWLVGACTDADGPTGEEYLLRVGERKVTGPEFEQVLEIAKMAYPPTVDANPEVLEVVRHRLLVEMIEELLILQRADQLGIGISEEELEERVEEIRQDYTQEAFEQIFVEQAVSFELWKSRTRVRLLLDKVIAADLAERSLPASPAVLPPDGRIPGADQEEDLEKARLEGRPSTASNGRYEEWVRKLAATFPTEINTVLWRKLYGP